MHWHYVRILNVGFVEPHGYCGWCDCGLCGGGPPPYLNRLAVARAARLRSDGDGLAAEGEGTASSTQGRPLSWDCGGKPYSWSACARWSGCCSARGFDADWQAKPLISLDSDGSNSGSVAISMLSVAYARQISANGGQIDNLKASQRQMQGCADLDVLSVRLVATVRSRRHRD